MRFGLFGTGPWAHLAHAPALAAHPDVEFVGVWGRDPAKAAALAQEHGAKPYAEVDDLIADVDAIAVALPPDIQAGIALRAARAGKHLLLDKPVAFTPEAANEIVAAAKEHEVAGVVFFTRRFMPQIQEFIEQVRATEGWLEARIDHLGSIFQPGNPFGASVWRKEGGGLWDVGPHALALILPVLGPVAEVTALAGARDMTHVLLGHTSGAISTLTLSVDAPEALEREDAAFFGESGVATVPPVPWLPVEAFGRAVDDLISASKGGPASPLDLTFGTEVVTILAAAAESIRTGTTVKPA
ncbi:Gfo/Idh/MocA family protein [Actinoplanes friuliensis]|uniref:Inositol 2-dehydrogenase/D-chiro-inositol 3-dehydrogenase n=1 Tax=Actinoplanes friuliensis DSM 7358 TaxID=1246995 RepID=U5W9H7_9ACTN|nr:Gfo/Idh/MocA family oxidoreductase [Actinoplanes friuliensis]AGZ45804.1 Inositol 2-dehydrogenase/D-chiro-inositol 3-dehydrogenase [Actinoplanes friuliensis DSM 7358]